MQSKCWVASIGRVVSLVVVHALVASLFACAGAQGPVSSGGGTASASAAGFPSRAAVKQLASTQPPTLMAPAWQPVREFTLIGPFPSVVGDTPLEPRDALSTWLVHKVGPRATAQAACVARQLGALPAFAHDLSSLPPRLEAMVMTRCGSGAGALSMRALQFDELSADRDEASLREQQAASLDQIMKDLVATPGAVGVTFVRDQAAGAYVFVRLSPGANVAESVRADGRFTVQGIAPANSDLVQAYITLGELDTAECTPDDAVAAPGYRFFCALDANDVSGRIEVTSRERGRQLASVVGQAFVTRDASAATVYTEFSGGDAAGASGDATFREQLTARINALRVAAKREPLALEAEQSSTAAALAPHYFASQLGGAGPDHDARDLAVLGLLAGWDVRSLTIGNGSFYAAVGAADADRFVGAALDAPGLRRTLFAAPQRALAIGDVRIDAHRSGVLFTAYQPLPTLPKNADRLVFERLKAQRIARGMTGLGEIPVEATMKKAEHALRKGARVDGVVDDALDESVNIMQRSFVAWTFTTQDIEHIVFPDALLTPNMTYVAVAVAPTREPSSPWGTFAVIMVGFVDNTKLQTAALDVDTASSVSR